MERARPKRIERGMPETGIAVSVVRRDAEVKPRPIVVQERARPGRIEGGVWGVVGSLDDGEVEEERERYGRVNWREGDRTPRTRRRGLKASRIISFEIAKVRYQCCTVQLGSRGVNWRCVVASPWSWRKSREVGLTND